MFSVFLCLGLADPAGDASEVGAGCPFVTDGCDFYVNTTEMKEKKSFYVPFETKCTLNFTSCRTGGCYTIFDSTANMKVGYAPKLLRSLFDEVSVTGARWKLFDSGIVFKPTTTNFTFSFAVKNKTSFYTLHPFEPHESVSEYEISRIKYGLPVCYGI